MGSDGGSSQSRGRPGGSPARGFEAFTEKEVDSPQRYQRKLSAGLLETGCCSRGDGVRYRSLRPGSDAHSKLSVKR